MVNSSEHRTDLLNTIPIVQNAEPQLSLLAAQRALYSRAKHWVSFQVFSTSILAITFTIFGEQFAFLRPWGALAGLSILLMDTWGFDFAQKRLRDRAAKIQEAFDCEVLKLSWNEFWIGDKPDDEEIVEYATKYRKIDPKYSKLLDWYRAEVGRIPLRYARIICQRSNVRWDFKLRQLYGGVALALAVVSLATLIVGELLTHSSLADCLLSVVSLSPLLVWGGREFMRQREAAQNLQRLMGHVKGLWEEVKRSGLTEADSERESRALQDALFDHRRNSPVVFDWLYRFFKARHEIEGGETAKKMIKDISHLLSGEERKRDTRKRQSSPENERLNREKGTSK